MHIHAPSGPAGSRPRDLNWLQLLLAGAMIAVAAFAFLVVGTLTHESHGVSLRIAREMDGLRRQVQGLRQHAAKASELEVSIDRAEFRVTTEALLANEQAVMSWLLMGLGAAVVGINLGYPEIHCLLARRRSKPAS